jgi:hypothetical protein
MRRFVPMLLTAVALLAAGCGSNKAETTPSIPLLPDAKTSDEWALRIVNRFLTPLNKDLQVLNGLNSPQIRIYIASGNQTTISIVNKRMNDRRRAVSARRPALPQRLQELRAGGGDGARGGAHAELGPDRRDRGR